MWVVLFGTAPCLLIVMRCLSYFIKHCYYCCYCACAVNCRRCHGNAIIVMIAVPSSSSSSSSSWRHHLQQQQQQYDSSNSSSYPVSQTGGDEYYTASLTVTSSEVVPGRLRCFDWLAGESYWSGGGWACNCLQLSQKLRHCAPAWTQRCTQRKHCRSRRKKDSVPLEMHVDV